MRLSLSTRRSNSAENFPDLMLEFRQRAGVSRNQLGRDCGCDPSYFTRMENGGRFPGSFDIIVAICRRLKLNAYDRNRLIVAAGYAPECVSRIGGWEETLEAVALVLDCPTLTQSDKDEFSASVIHAAGLHLRLAVLEKELHAAIRDRREQLAALGAVAGYSYD